jgi:hypothetical protein
MLKSILSRLVAVGLMAGLLLGQSAAIAAENDLAAIGWLAGVWQSELKDGSQTVYVYVPLINGEMLSTQMGLRDGKTSRYEFRVIHEQNGQVLFQELAFKPDLSPGDPVPSRPLLAHDATHLDFTDMKVTRTGENAITVELTIHSPDGPRAVTVKLRRTMRFTQVK